MFHHYSRLPASVNSRLRGSMPNSAIKALMDHIRALEARIKAQDEVLSKHSQSFAKVETNIAWMMKIIAGAAGLGFIEKLLGWIIK